MVSEMDQNPLGHYPFASTRQIVLSTGGMVATSQPLAVQAGIGVLADGGNAVDAAIAAAAALTVVEPCSNGLGSDAFAIVWDGKSLTGLNASGRWPSAADADALRDAGHESVPKRGWAPVTVPGAVDGWAMLHERFGTHPIDRILQPAIGYATKGFPVTPVVAEQWESSAELFLSLELPEVAAWAEVFAPSGRAPRSGELWASPGHTRGLESLARSGLRDFYEGEVADAIATYAAQTGGLMTAADLASHHGEWVDPISVSYRGHEVWEIPPNGQGIAALMALGIYGELDSDGAPQMSAANWHRQVEAMKLAFADSDAFVADQQHVDVPVQAMIDPSYLKKRSELIGEMAGPAPQGDPVTGGTVYLCTADKDGMMVSFIQSNYAGFGSGVVVPSHGISLQNRGAGFSLDPAHPNAAAPNKRPRHTIIPGFLTKNGKPVGPFGVMGAEMQPQGHLQVISGMIDHGLNPQATLDAPRWQVDRDGTVRVEAETSPDIISGLEARGHQVVVEQSRLSFGRGQIIQLLDGGVYAGGSEPRADGYAAGI